MGCCGSKKDVQPEPEEPEQKLSIEELKNKYAKSIPNFIFNEDIQKLEEAIQDGFTPDIAFDYEGEQTTALVLSIIFQKQLVFDKLIQVDQDFNIELGDQQYVTIYYAITNGNPKMVEQLLKAGADSYKNLSITLPNSHEYVTQKVENRGFMNESDKFKELLAILERHDQ